MTPKYSVLLMLISLTLFGCRDSNPQAIAPKSPIPNRSRIQGLNARVGRPTGSQFAPTAFDVSPANMNWPQFRGDHGRSIAEREDLAKNWSEERGIYWKTELPGRGASSPIILFKYVYLTAASGYGMAPDDQGDVQQLRHHLICIDRQTGDYVWQRDIQGSPLTRELGSGVIDHGFATSTPVADGQMEYAFFGASGVFAFDQHGELVWQADVGFQTSPSGSGASLMLYKDLLIVNASIENQTVYAFDKTTGAGVWKIDGIDRSCSTPVIDKSPEGSDELIIVEEDYVRGFNPKTGEALWHCEGIHGNVVSTPFVQEGVCFCNGGIPNQMIAIKLGGRGDVTQTHKLWEVPSGASVNSPIYLTGYLYLISDDGQFQCFNARDGALVASHPLPGKSRAYASPLLSGGTFYVPLEENGVVVCEANSKLEQISHNTFADDPPSITGTPSVSEAALFLRSDRYLYRISQRSTSPVVVSRSSFSKESSLIIPPERYDFDPETGRLREYNQFLSKDGEAVDRAILQPFGNVLTEAQVVDAREIIDKAREKFVEMRQQQRDALWSFLQATPRNPAALNLDLANLDQQVMDEVKGVRNQIEAILSDDQKTTYREGNVDPSTDTNLD